MYKKEAKIISEIFKSEIKGIHHIGSTSVVNLISKPIIDIMVVVKDIERIDSFNSAMMDIGYEPKGESGIPKRRFFQKGENNRTHHVHFYEKGEPEIKRHLSFRNYLRAHPDVAEKYGSFKKELAKHFPDDIEAYIKGKEQLVKEIEEKAVDWDKKVDIDEE